MRSARYGRRALLVISDGGDNSSLCTLKQTKKLVRDSDVWVYAIGIFDTGPFETLEEAYGERTLGEIIDASGGRTIAVDLPKVPEAAATISKEIRNQYILGYKPPKTSHGGSPQKIKIKIEVSVPPGHHYTYYKTAYIPTESAAVSQ